jgi:large subunit ribosomal protein L32
MPKVKHRHSKTRGRKRRTHYKATAPVGVKCSHCGKIKRPAQVCQYCGYFKGVQVKKIETVEERKERRESKKTRS